MIFHFFTLGINYRCWLIFVCTNSWYAEYWLIRNRIVRNYLIVYNCLYRQPQIRRKIQHHPNLSWLLFAIFSISLLKLTTFRVDADSRLLVQNLIQSSHHLDQIWLHELIQYPKRDRKFRWFTRSSERAPAKHYLSLNFGKWF